MTNSFINNTDVSEYSLLKRSEEKRHLEVFYLELTARCNNNCRHCYINLPQNHKISRAKELSLTRIKKIIDQAVSLGALRCVLTGGEPLLRKDLPEVLDLFYGNFVIGLPTNAIKVAPDLARILEDKIDFANIGLDGPRNVTTRQRGSYDKILKGVYLLKRFNIPISLSCVVLSSTVDSVLLTCQIADLLEAKKLKLILPISKGNALDLPAEEYLEIKESEILFENVRKAKEK